MHLSSLLLHPIALEMVGMPFSPSKRDFIAGETNGKSHRQVAREKHCSPSTVAYAVCQQRERGSNTTPKRPGRPRSLTERDMHHIRQVIVANRRRSLRQLLPLLSEINLPLSLSSLKRVFKRLGLMQYIARVKPFLNKKAKFQRIKYAMVHQHDTPQAWQSTIFVDEAAIRLDGNMRTFVSRREGEAYLPDCLRPRLHALRGTCMVWAAVWHGGRSKLIRFDQSESKGKKGGVTAAIYQGQITKGELRRNWRQVLGNGGAMDVLG